jgi:sensor histidine kinase YesM
MADSIKNLKIENYEKEIAKQKMELRNLQLQTRPHFLLNMFKLIYGLVQMQDLKSIQKTVLYLSHYFRYIFRSGNELESFEQEYNLIREYLEISEIRYPELFSAEYEVEQDVFKAKVPPLLFHNFVENVIIHALVEGVTVDIKMTARYIDGWLEFILTDNGSGMKQDTLDRINSGKFTMDDGKRVHLGVYNSYQRIRYYYGEESELRIESVVGEGTSVIIRLPCEEREVISE